MKRSWMCNRWLSRVFENSSRTFWFRHQGHLRGRKPHLTRAILGQAAETLEDRLLLATIVVDDDGEQNSIQDAIDDAVAGDVILVTGGADGIHTEAGIIINKDVTVRGASGSSQVIVQSAEFVDMAIDRVFSVASETTAFIDNLTIRHGNVTDFSFNLSGGGILNEGFLTISNSTITENFSLGDGGGIFNLHGGLAIHDSTISNNTAGDDGGGLGNIQFQGPSLNVTGGDLSRGEVHISLGLITNNSAANFGGGISNTNGSLEIFSSTISENTSDNDGGGISNDSGGLRLVDSTVHANTTLGGEVGGDGGGIHNENGSVIILRSTISENSAQDDGGGIDNIAGSVNLTNSTISGNTAGGDGGGVRNSDTLVATNSTVVLNVGSAGGVESGIGGGIDNFAGESEVFALLYNTIVAGNSLGSGSASDLTGLDLDADSAFNLIGDPNSSGGLVDGNNGNIVGRNLADVLDPNLAYNGGPTLTHQLISGSSAIDAGSNSLAFGPDEQPLTIDQRGFPRIIDIPGVPNAAGGVDIGAVEVDVTTFDIFALDANKIEGNSGETAFIFLVARNGNRSGETTVDFTLTFLTTDANDFASNQMLMGTVLFEDGDPFQEIRIIVKGDTFLETNETFRMVLSNPSDGTDIGISSAQGIIRNDENLQVFGAGSGSGIDSMPPQVIVQLSATSEQVPAFQNFLAYDVGFRGGVRVATADVNRDGVADVITAPGVGGGPHIRVFDGLTAQVIANFFAYDPGFTGGVFVAAGDVNGDGFADIITGAGAGGGPHVKVFSGEDFGLLHSFFAYDAGFLGGVSVAAGDVNNDSSADVITGAGAGGGPHVRVFDGQNGRDLASFFAYDPGFLGGITVASGHVNEDGFAEVITGAGRGGGPHVRIFDGQNPGQILSEFFAYDPNMTAGLFVGTTDTDGDGLAEILVGTGPGPSDVRVFSPTGVLLDQFIAVFNPHFRSGVHVAGSMTSEPSDVSFPQDPVEDSFLSNGGSFLGQVFNDSMMDALLLDFALTPA